MTAPVYDVVLRLPSGVELALCSPETAAGHSWAFRLAWTWPVVEEMTNAVRNVFEAFPGAQVTTAARALAEATDQAIERGVFDDPAGRLLAERLGIDLRWRTGPKRAA